MHKSVAAVLSLVVAALVAVPASAGAEPQKTPEIDRDLVRLALALHNSTELTDAELEKARWHLSRALAILERRGPTTKPDGAASSNGSYDYDACVEIAREAYARSHAAATARRLATDGCEGWRQLDLTRLLYDAYARSYAPPTAMNLALKHSADRRLGGKKAILEYAIASYSKSYAPPTAVKRALEEAVKLRPAALDCVRRANRAYAEDHPAFTALDKAFARCRER